MASIKSPGHASQ